MDYVVGLYQMSFYTFEDSIEIQMKVQMSVAIFYDVITPKNPQFK